MTEIKKRILSSIGILLLIIISSYNNTFLGLVSIFVFFQLFYEFLNIYKKIINKNKVHLYFVLFFTLLYLLACLILIWSIIVGNLSSEKIYLYIIIITCMSSDIGGFTFGKLFKGKKLTKISPNKTYSGVIGSYILSFIAVYSIFDLNISINKILLFTFIISSISQLGDLIVSILKRKAKVKDTGNLIPGHGGLLDRLDGYIFAIPFGILISYII